MKTTWITFYSYKGGVGRSLAVANVAGYLATLGRRVVMIDFDLEAPGLDSFKEFSHEGQQGVVEYVDEFLRTKVTPPIQSYVHPCASSVALEGKLWLMPSGKKDDAYAERLYNIPWRALYDAGVAQPFIENWKLAIEQAFAPDYVLIDSRTGLTDIGGICTLHFPEIVVLFFALNRQNLMGIAVVTRAIAKVRNREPIQVLTVASPVPSLPRDSGALKDRLDQAREILGTPVQAMISYYPSLALVEGVWTLDSTSPIAKDYKRLTEQILNRLHDGIDFLIARADAVIEKADDAAGEQIIEALSTGYSHRSVAFRTIARLERMLGKRDKSQAALERAFEIDPSDGSAFTDLANQYRSSGKTDLLRKLIENAEKHVPDGRIKRFGEIWFEVGLSAMQLRDYNRAVRAYTKAIDCNLENLEAATLFNLAEARRRADGVIYHGEWEKVLLFFQKNSFTLAVARDDETAPLLANRLQALHLLYAITGDSGEAQESLQRAIVVASSLNPAAAVFSLESFTEISPRDFVTQLEFMAKALSEGKLWDGMRIPANRLI